MTAQDTEYIDKLEDVTRNILIAKTEIKKLEAESFLTVDKEKVLAEFRAVLRNNRRELKKLMGQRSRLPGF